MRQKGLTEMKNDSNMFNDNSIETEGIPADKTAEIPKVVGSTEEENAKKPLVLFGREFSRKQVCVAGAGILCAALTPSHMPVGREIPMPLRCPSQRTMRSRTWYLPLR